MSSTPHVAIAAPSSFPLRLAGRVVAYAFFLVPQRYRFDLALRVARLLEPLIACTGAWHARQRLRTDRVRETSADLLLTILTRYGALYEPKLHFELGGIDNLPPPGTGVLLLGPHTMLSALFMRELDNAGYVAWAAAADGAALPGSRRPARVLLPSPSLPLRIRGKVREGCVVFAMVDRGEVSRHTVRYELATGPMRVSDGLFRLALATKTPTCFIATRIEGFRVVCRIRPADPAARDRHALLGDFARFADAALRFGEERPGDLASPEARQAGT